MSADDTLAAIDAAVDGRCACGCGQPVGDGGPSAWFASESCQRRWNSLRVRSPERRQVWPLVDDVEPASPSPGTLLPWQRVLDGFVDEAFDGLVADAAQPPAPTATAEDVRRAMARVAPLIPERPVARVEMHPGLIEGLRGQCEMPAERPWAGRGVGALYGVPIVPDDSLPVGGWRVLDRDGGVIAERLPGGGGNLLGMFAGLDVGPEDWVDDPTVGRDGVLARLEVLPATEVVTVPPTGTWRPAREGDTPGELVPEHGPTWPIRADEHRSRSLWRRLVDRTRRRWHQHDGINCWCHLTGETAPAARKD